MLTIKVLPIEQLSVLQITHDNLSSLSCGFNIKCVARFLMVILMYRLNVMLYYRIPHDNFNVSY